MSLHTIFIVAATDILGMIRSINTAPGGAELEMEIMATVREFSAVGPCISLGDLLKTTATSVFYRDRDGATVRVGGRRVADGLVHTSACRSCRDHAQTQYADGYQD